MSKTEIIRPKLGNFIESLRDLGYSFEVAVADLIDNSITAKASAVKIYSVANPKLIFSLLDNGTGMSETELKEAMRMAAKSPKAQREKNDLGRFGLGLKTASFSQCKKLTVVTKKNNSISARQWDLDYISGKDEWLLITPENYEKLPLLNELTKQKSGTLVVWENLDRFQERGFTDSIHTLRKHLALVFHRFLEGLDFSKRLLIEVNNNRVKPFNPFNKNHPATQEISEEKIKVFGAEIKVQPFILPHHSKISQQEYELYATEDGYIKSQGFYLYRCNRILIYGTWWGLHKIMDAHKLVRVRIDIPNNMDIQWGIDVKKSIARPAPEIREDLKRIINQVSEKGSRIFTGRGRKIEDKTITRFWNLVPANDDFYYKINKEHPLYLKLLDKLKKSDADLLNIFIQGIEAYLPLESIQASLQKHPHNIKQEEIFSENDLRKLVNIIKSSGADKTYVEDLLKTEIFRNHKELLNEDK